jgi:4-diphosphocytidyl-2-C-methyl-D-erythritol kinase
MDCIDRGLGARQVIVGAIAPAKINLGLEVLDRRDDGFHEIRTILATVSLFDLISVQPAATVEIDLGQSLVIHDPNTIASALDVLRRTHPAITPAISLEKHIPIAAGLGGGSSDAAATLLALDRAYSLDTSPARLGTLAAEIGSDVPFFLTGGLALASGRGEKLQVLPPIEGFFAVIVSPLISIPAKTATLYRSLDGSDFTDGRRVRQLAGSNPGTWYHQPELLSNAFERPLYNRVPDLRNVAAAMRAMSARTVALSGAGPAHYVLEQDLKRASWLCARFAAHFGDRAAVTVTRFLDHGAITHAANDLTEVGDWFTQFSHN